MLEMLKQKLDNKTRERLEYYKSLGYSDAQSFTLATLTYGNSVILYKYMNFRKKKGKGDNFCLSYYNYVIEHIEQYHTEDLCNSEARAFYNFCESQSFDIRNPYIDEEKIGFPVLSRKSSGLKGRIRTTLDSIFGGPSVNYSAKSSRSISNMGVMRDSSCPAEPEGLSRESAIMGGASPMMSTPMMNSMSMANSIANAMPMASYALPSGGGINVEGINVDMADIADEEIDIDNCYTDNYATYEENKANDVLTNPTSSIRMTCNTASMGTLLNTFRTNLKHLDYSMVRIEEMLNYFEFSKICDEETDVLFDIQAELSDMPGGGKEGKKLLLLNIHGKKIGNSKAVGDIKNDKNENGRKNDGEDSVETDVRQNIAILLDTSGSMCGNNIQTQLAIFTIIAHMDEGDRFSLITYSSKDHTIFKNLRLSGDKIDEIIESVFAINITGCTNGSAGINTAYDCIGEIMQDGRYDTNRVVLITDGDLNFGVTSHGGLENLIKDKKTTGAYLSVIGTGLYNYKDSTLEVLAKNGNGNYCTVNNIWDVRESIDKNYQEMMFTLAKDVKAQIEFNPKFIRSYKLVGYENRQISHQEFYDDNVISEPFGRGAGVAVLYEIVMAGDGVQVPEHPYKYQEAKVADSDEYFTVKIRYRNVDDKDDAPASSEEKAFTINDISTADSDNIKLASVIYVLAEKIKGRANISKAMDEYVKDIFEDPVDKIAGLYDLGSNREKIDMLREMCFMLEEKEEGKEEKYGATD